MAEKHVDQAELDRVVAAVREVPEELFRRYRGARRDQVATALVDAVFSIRARYGGVARRLEEFAQHMGQDGVDSLTALATLDEATLRSIMGDGVTAGRSKASAAIEAAVAFRKLTGTPGEPLETAASVRRLIECEVSHADRPETERLKKAYTGVKGLGWVTFEYFLMLLGVPGVKADTMIRGFIAEALDVDKDAVSAHHARALVVHAHQEIWPEHDGPSLTAYDHGLWLYQRSR